jgi:peptidoglycan/LPS O-acetylase OafA/YrhL
MSAAVAALNRRRDPRLAEKAARMEPRGAHIRGLDGLRACAVLAVIAFHYSSDVIPGGFVGVDVFFVLSGFLITSLLLAERGNVGRFSFRNFYIRRGLRLFPALIVAVPLAAVCAQLVPAAESRGSLTGSVSALTYTTDFLLAHGMHVGLLGHTWSLAVEEQFYLLWPVTLLVLLRWRTAGYLVAVLTIGFAALTAALVPVMGVGSQYFSPWTHMAELLAGAGLAMSRHNGTVPGWLTRWGWIGVCPLMIALVSLQMGDRILYFGGWLGLAMCSVGVIAHIAGKQRGLLAWTLSIRPIEWIGKRSYGIYLFSAPITYVVLAQHYRVSVGGALTIALAFSCAGLSYAVIERPALLLKGRFVRAPSTTERGRASTAANRALHSLAPAEGVAS